MRTLEEIKTATAKLDPEEQFELFRWWTNSETFRAGQLALLKQDLTRGVEQLEDGQSRTYDDASLMQLAEEVGRRAVERSKDGQNKPPL